LFWRNSSTLRKAVAKKSNSPGLKAVPTLRASSSVSRSRGFQDLPPPVLASCHLVSPPSHPRLAAALDTGTFAPHATRAPAPQFFRRRSSSLHSLLLKFRAVLLPPTPRLDLSFWRLFSVRSSPEHRRSPHQCAAFFFAKLLRWILGRCHTTYKPVRKYFYLVGR
jgi:hypothetical protein